MILPHFYRNISYFSSGYKYTIYSLKVWWYKSTINMNNYYCFWIPLNGPFRWQYHSFYRTLFLWSTWNLYMSHNTLSSELKCSRREKSMRSTRNDDWSWKYDIDNYSYSRNISLLSFRFLYLFYCFCFGIFSLYYK